MWRFFFIGLVVVLETAPLAAHSNFIGKSTHQGETNACLWRLIHLCQQNSVAECQFTSHEVQFKKNEGERVVFYSDIKAKQENDSDLGWLVLDDRHEGVFSCSLQEDFHVFCAGRKRGSCQTRVLLGHKSCQLVNCRRVTKKVAIK